MSEEAFKLYERNCGEAGKFIVLEAGREKSDGTYEGVSMYGHYYVDANYDGTYVKIVFDDNYGLYQLWNNIQNKVLRLYLPEKIQSSLEAMVESKSEKAKSDEFNQFLQQCKKDGRDEVKYANPNCYSQNSKVWKEITPTDEYMEMKEKEYKEFFKDAGEILKKEGFAKLYAMKS